MLPKQLLIAYKAGENISQLMKATSAQKTNSEDIIETAYDLQAGSYIDRIESNPASLESKMRYTNCLVDRICKLTSCVSLLEAGVGEATTLAFVIKAFEERNFKPEYIHGFDISWSRIACARDFLIKKEVDKNTFTFVASLFELPYMDSSFDVVYTSHSIEPNGGKEIPILKELYRVCSRYLILLEPGYEIATPEAQARMELHGYCKGLKDKAEGLGYKVITFENFLEKPNLKNPTAITIIEKNPSAPAATPQFACPIYKTSLARLEDCYYSEDSMRAYPILGSIPCLRPENAIIASAYRKFF